MTTDILNKLTTTLEAQGKAELKPIEIETLDKDKFLQVVESLTRMGVKSVSQNDGKDVLWQSAHLLHKKGRYFICHFKHLFLLDGKADKTVLTEEDFNRTVCVASLLQKWGLVKVVGELPETKKTTLTIIPFKDKSNWVLKTKYSMSKPKAKTEQTETVTE